MLCMEEIGLLSQTYTKCTHGLGMRPEGRILFFSHFTDEFNVFSLDVPHYQHLHFGQEVQSHIIYCIPMQEEGERGRWGEEGGRRRGEGEEEVGEGEEGRGKKKWGGPERR